MLDSTGCVSEECDTWGPVVSAQDLLETAHPFYCLLALPLVTFTFPVPPNAPICIRSNRP